MRAILVLLHRNIVPVGPVVVSEKTVSSIWCIRSPELWSHFLMKNMICNFKFRRRCEVAVLLAVVTNVHSQHDINF